MKEDKDYNRRLEGHAEPLEIEEHYAEPKAAKAPRAAAKAPRAKTVATPVGTERAGGGGIGWAAIGGIAAAFLVCAVYVGSGWGRKAEPPMPLTQSETIAVIEPAVQTSQTSPTSPTSPTSQSDAVYLFPVNGTQIADDAALNEIARQAKETGADVEITAYTDPSGSAAYNQKLSERRAKAVADYLAAHGVDPSHIRTQGRGPTAAYATPAQDRRAEVHLL